MGAWLDADPWKMKLQKSSGIKLWKSDKKETEWTQFAKNAPGDIETIYVEVTKKSDQMSDMWIKVSHTFHSAGGAGPVMEEFDRIAITGIWCDLVEVKSNTQSQLEILNVDNTNNKLKLHVAGITPLGAPEVGDLVTIFDDKNTWRAPQKLFHVI